MMHLKHEPEFDLNGTAQHELGSCGSCSQVPWSVDGCGGGRERKQNLELRDQGGKDW